MTPQEIQQIAYCLTKRVQPKDAEEGGVLLMLAQKLVAENTVKPPTLAAVPKVDER